jgi:hypothetical protein
MDVMCRAGLLSRGIDILDCGAGDGWFSGELMKHSSPGTTITCWDAAYTPHDISVLAGTQAEGIRFSAERPGKKYRLVLLLDVLEHVEDDRLFLDSLVDENLESHAHFLISVPAWPQLFGQHDVRLQHHRRYAPRDCRRLLEATGLRILRSGGLFHSLLLPRAVQVICEKTISRGHPAGGGLGEWHHGPVLTTAVTTALGLDNLFSHLFSTLHVPVPGLSWWALCKKP